MFWIVVAAGTPDKRVYKIPSKSVYKSHAVAGPGFEQLLVLILYTREFFN
jgi:hypothetical protein